MVHRNFRKVDMQNGEVGVDSRPRAELNDDLDALLLPDLGDLMQKVKRLVEGAVTKDKNQDARWDRQMPNLPAAGGFRGHLLTRSTPNSDLPPPAPSLIFAYGKNKGG